MVQDNSRLNSVIFTIEIEQLVKELNISYIDAVLLYCEISDLEIEVVSSLIHGSLKSKIRTEAEDLHFLQRSNTERLPI